MKNKDEIECLNRIYMELADRVGLENAKIIHKEYQGQQINFPMNFFSREYIHNQVSKEFDGTNVKQLATKYNCSERTIRRIISGKKL